MAYLYRFQDSKSIVYSYVFPLSIVFILSIIIMHDKNIPSQDVILAYTFNKSRSAFKAPLQKLRNWYHRSFLNREDPPAEFENGINYLDDSTVAFVLYAPQKATVHLIGEFNDWQLEDTYKLKQSIDGAYFWIVVDGLIPRNEYAYQYVIDRNLTIADPFAEKILDPDHDFFISDTVYPDLKAYPPKAKGMVSVFETGQPEFEWQTNDWEKPAVTDLVIYELLVRDFTQAHTFEALTDSLDYLENLGVNAIELLPVMEFEANSSWGYNPSFHMALDKYYGTPEALKTFIDACHKRGIIVLLDMVLNHAFGQSPLVQMYWDSSQNRPATNSPYLNPTAKHPFNVGYDFNHESQATQAFVDQVLEYWIAEYRFDGYRMDLSKGFTQVDTGDDIAKWSEHDETRIRILKRMADTLWAKYPETLMILEHFADNQEEIELEQHGFLLWGNINFQYSEAVMGYHEDSKSNFQGISYQAKGWDNPHLVGYMESHDEERILYKALQFGNQANSYNVQELTTALERLQLAAVFFFTIPGPKMIWQFGELGYDISIDFNGRTGEKPILWEYMQDPSRKAVYDMFSRLISLKKTVDVFKTSDFSLSLDSYAKRIILQGSTNEVVILGNFDVIPRSINPGFTEPGVWYDYFGKTSIDVSDISAPIDLQPGAFYLYSKNPLPDDNPTTSVFQDLPTHTHIEVYPNPGSKQVYVSFELAKSSHICLELWDFSGKKAETIYEGKQTSGNHKYLVPNSVAAGRYVLTFTENGQLITSKQLQLY